MEGGLITRPVIWTLVVGTCLPTNSSAFSHVSSFES